jgi:5'(3')-deoxyribonucleotidase
LDLDILIDDGLHNLENFKGKKVVFDRPWNKDSTIFNCDYRMKMWNEDMLTVIKIWQK